MGTEKPRHWQKNTLQLLFILIAGIFFTTFVVVIILGYKLSWDWTGLTPSIGPNIRQYEPAKTLWDWLQLLIVPIVLASAAFLFNLAVTRNQAIVDKKRDDLQYAIASANQQEALLQRYLDRMSELLLNKGLRTPGHNTEERNIARARTLTALSGLGKDRKGNLIKFLYESGLIGTDGMESIIDLSQADLSQANLARINLAGAKLSQVDLSEADLTDAKLSNADLTGAILTKTILVGTKLGGANLTKANLSQANLTDANLNGAKLHQATLAEAILRSTNLTRAKLIEADLQDADLSIATATEASFHRANLARAQLIEANLKNTDLSMTNLKNADLSEAIMTDADLHLADLEGAHYIEEQLKKTKRYQKV